MTIHKLKPLLWIGGCKKDLLALPASVRQFFGHALHLAQHGSQLPSAKVLRGFGNARVIELINNTPDGTFRAIYTFQCNHAVCVLHCFQKKSSSGIATPKPHIDIIRARMKQAEAVLKEFQHGTLPSH